MQVVEKQEVMMEVQVSGLQVLHLVSWGEQTEVQTSVMHLLRAWEGYGVPMQMPMQMPMQGKLLTLVEVYQEDLTQPSDETERNQCSEGEQAAPGPYFI